MKKLGLIGKLIFFVNSIFAILLLLGYLLPYIPPHLFPRLAVLSLVVPPLIAVNALFLLYWVIRMRRQFLLSGLVLLLGIGHISSLYRFAPSEPVKTAKSLSIMSFNVHSFTIDGTVPRTEVWPQLKAFIAKENPDILSLQEYHPNVHFRKEYPYNYAAMRNAAKTFGQIIYSKYPIVNSGSINFEKSGNNAIYADVVKEGDTLRVYNMHLQSFRLSADFNDLQQQDSKRLLGRMGDAFVKQESQMNLFLEHESKSPYPVIVAGDFNNSATSYVYRKVKGEKVDAFAKAGSGTGRSFTFDFVPLRIDFILADPDFKVHSFENYNIKLSDHYPIMAQFGWD